MRNVAVIGASGVVGRNLIPRLIEAGHSVRAGVRTLGTALPLPNVVEVQADILDPKSVARLLDGSDVVVNVASSIPHADGTGGDWKLYDRIRREGTQNLIDAATVAGVVIVAQSIAMLHCTDQSRAQDERTPMKGGGVRDAAIDSERLLAGWNGDWRIVRGGNLYGPGTTTDTAWFDRYRGGTLTLPGDGSDWVSPIHIADLAAAFHTVLERASPQSAWIAADDEPMQWNDLYHIIAALARHPNDEPTRGAAAVLPSFRVSNAALRSLGWTPCYSSVRSGLIAG